jgi:iron-sulfur cluster repair protein YtfE (RIC family)
MNPIEQLVLDENNIAFHPMMGNSYQLNDIANDIVTMLKHHKNKDEIIDELSNKYEVSKNELFIDVSDFMSKLKVYGLA